MSTAAPAAGLDLYDEARARRELPALSPLRWPLGPYARTATHRLLPRRVALALLDVSVAIRWRLDAGYRATLRGEARLLPAPADGAARLDRLARAYGREHLRRDEDLWRPWLPGPSIEGADAARRLAQEGGLLVHFLHHGPYYWAPRAVRLAGIPALVPIGSFNFEAPKPGYRGHKDRQQLLVYSQAQPVFDAVGSRDGLVAALAAGQAVAITSDLPGNVPLTLFGRRVGAAGGVARLARATGVPIVPLTCAPDRRYGARFTFHPPVRPEDHPDTAALLQAVMDVHVPALAAWPAAWEWPGGRYGPPPA